MYLPIATHKKPAEVPAKIAPMGVIVYLNASLSVNMKYPNEKFRPWRGSHTLNYSSMLFNHLGIASKSFVHTATVTYPTIGLQSMFKIRIDA